MIVVSVELWIANAIEYNIQLHLKGSELMNISSIRSVIITLFNQENKFVLSYASVNLLVSTKIRKQSKKQLDGGNK